MSYTIEVPRSIVGLTVFIIVQLVFGAIIIFGNEYGVIFVIWGIIGLFLIDSVMAILFKRFGKIRVTATEEWIVLNGVKFARQDISGCSLSNDGKDFLISFNKPPLLPLFWRLANFAKIEEWRPEKMRSRSAAIAIIIIPLNRVPLAERTLIESSSHGWGQ